MGLDDYKKDKEYEVGNVSSRKDISNIKLSKNTWDHIIGSDPGIAEAIAGDLDEEGVKAVIELLDRAINNDLKGWNIPEERAEEFRYIRDNIVDAHL